MRALSPFFEIIAISNMPSFEMDQIIAHIESVLNRPSIEVLKREAIEIKEF